MNNLKCEIKQELPCIDCIVYPMCKSKHFSNKETTSNISTALAIMLAEDSCKPLKLYLELYDYEVTDEMLKIEKINQHLRRIRKDRYNKFMDHMEVKYGSRK